MMPPVRVDAGPYVTLLEKAKEMFADLEPVREVYDVSPIRRVFGSWGNLCSFCEQPLEAGQEVRIVLVRQPGTLWANKHEYWIHTKHWKGIDGKGR